MYKYSHGWYQKRKCRHTSRVTRRLSPGKLVTLREYLLHEHEYDPANELLSEHAGKPLTRLHTVLTTGGFAVMKREDVQFQVSFFSLL